MKIVLLGSIALAGLVTPASASASAETATVASGVKSQITTHMSTDSQCNPRRVVIETLAAPANGTLSSEPKSLVVQAATPRGGQQPSKCVGKTVTGVAIFYQSKPGFVGQDSFRYRRSTPDRPGDAAAGEIGYTVTVK
jgi:hypothetical protein